MTIDDLIGKRLSLLMMGEDDSGKEEWAIFVGTTLFESGVLYLDRGTTEPRIEIRAEWLERVRPVADDMKKTFLDAEFFLPLTVGNIPADEDASTYERIGLKFPKS